ncbi:MAG: hypothetical protein E7052_00010 [Lentisphaerae bacterium]|nr:hypothetical protein [Lentisphaerota bacterium]
MSGAGTFCYQYPTGRLQWHEPSWYSAAMPDNTVCWHCRYTPGTGSACWSASAASQPEQELPANWICQVGFDDLQCEQMLTISDSMGNCHILTAATPQREFASCGMTVLKQGRDFILLEVASTNAGELFWCGVWENGFIRNFRAELRERFARKTALPEITIVIHRSGNLQQLLDEWTNKHYPQRSLRQSDDFSAWSSWDYYRWSVSAGDVLANAEFIAWDPVLSKHIKRIIIDDGWMNCYGEWEPNSRFKNMPELVKELNKMHFSAGLWFAPGIAEPQSLFAQKNWQYLARGENDWPCLAFECMSRRGFLLDPTRQEVQKYLFELFQHYRAMGFDYFKLDFLKHTLNARKFHDPYADANAIIRSLIRPIREGVGSEAILMGCNHLFPAGSEYLDIVRCASDIHANFDSIKTNSTSIAARLNLHERIWRNDPDFALVRGCDTSDDPAMDLLRPNQVYINAAANEFDDFHGQWSCAGQMTGSEAEILLSLILISGGERTFSDALFKLNDFGLELVRKAASAVRGRAGTADDLLQAEYAQKFTQQVSSKHWRKLWINWQPEEKSITLDKLPENATELSDFWHDRKFSRNQTVTLKPNSCLLLDIYC